MTKDNILFSIIGLLLGLFIGFVFANTVNQYYGVPRTPAAAATVQNAGLPPNHPALPSNGVADPQAMQADVQATIQQARNEPNNFDAQMKAALLYYQINRFDEAIEFLLRANQIRPDSYDAMVKLGDANFDAEHYDVAEKWYTAALVRNPNDINVRTDLGTTFLARQPPDFDRAVKEYRRSLEMDPKHEKTLHNLVIALTKKGDAGEAQATLEKLEAVNPQNEDLPRLRSELDALRSQKK